MTTAEMLEAVGEARGEARGFAKGFAEMLVHVLTVKFGSVPESVSQRVREASSEQVQDWAARAVTAETLEQAFD